MSVVILNSFIVKLSEDKTSSSTHQMYSPDSRLMVNLSGLEQKTWIKMKIVIREELMVHIIK